MMEISFSAARCSSRLNTRRFSEHAFLPFRNHLTRAKSAVRFQTRVEAVACIYRAITFTGNVFDGNSDC